MQLKKLLSLLLVLVLLGLIGTIGCAQKGSGVDPAERRHEQIHSNIDKTFKPTLGVSKYKISDDHLTATVWVTKSLEEEMDREKKVIFLKDISTKLQNAQGQQQSKVPTEPVYTPIPPLDNHPTVPGYQPIVPLDNLTVIVKGSWGKTLYSFDKGVYNIP